MAGLPFMIIDKASLPELLDSGFVDNFFVVKQHMIISYYLYVRTGNAECVTTLRTPPMKKRNPGVFNTHIGAAVDEDDDNCTSTCVTNSGEDYWEICELEGSAFLNYVEIIRSIDETRTHMPCMLDIWKRIPIPVDFEELDCDAIGIEPKYLKKYVSLCVSLSKNLAMNCMACQSVSELNINEMTPRLIGKSTQDDFSLVMYMMNAYSYTEWQSPSNWSTICSFEEYVEFINDESHRNCFLVFEGTSCAQSIPSIQRYSKIVTFVYAVTPVQMGTNRRFRTSSCVPDLDKAQTWARNPFLNVRVWTIPQTNVMDRINAHALWDRRLRYLDYICKSSVDFFCGKEFSPKYIYPKAHFDVMSAPTSFTSYVPDRPMEQSTLRWSNVMLKYFETALSSFDGTIDKRACVSMTLRNMILDAFRNNIHSSDVVYIRGSDWLNKTRDNITFYCIRAATYGVFLEEGSTFSAYDRSSIVRMSVWETINKKCTTQQTCILLIIDTELYETMLEHMRPQHAQNASIERGAFDFERSVQYRTQYNPMFQNANYRKNLPNYIFFV